MSEFNRRLYRSKVVGVAGAMVAAAVLPALAQTATPQPAAASDCSGLMCVFAPSRPTPAPAPVAAVPAPQPTPVAAEDTTPPAPSAAAPARPKAKPVRPLTIRADATQTPRLQALVASMPKERVKIVTGDRDADFAVSTAFDPHEGAPKAKLFTETLHVVAGGEVHALADLKGKVVSFGAEGSPSQAAARKAFQSLAIDVRETPLEVDNALDGLSTGDINAVVILAPEPIRSLTTMATPGLHLVAWPDNHAMPDGAVSASIEGADYPGLAKPGDHIPALGLDAVLTVSPKAAHLPATKTFLTALSQHSAALSRHGFDLLKADLDSRADRRVASAERR